MLGNLLRNSKRLLGQLKLDLNSFTGQASSGSNVIHNHAMVILVVAPADAGPQLGGGGISWLGKLENLSRGRHKTFKRHTKNAETRLEYIFKSTAVQRPAKLYAWRVTVRAVGRQACQASAGILTLAFSKDTYELTYFRADNHTLDFMAVDPSVRLSRYGCWGGYDWQGRGRLTSPKKSADDVDVYVILTGLHWYSGANGTGDGNIKLITTYRHHGIQWLSSNRLVCHPRWESRLRCDRGWDCNSLGCDARRPMTISPTYPCVQLRLYALSSQFNTHFPQAGVTIHAIACMLLRRAGLYSLATASRDEVRVWRAISGGRNSALESLAWVHRRRNSDWVLFRASHYCWCWAAALVCAVASLLVPAFWSTK
ncbi:hypothetical protein EDB84DRAFT_1439951 [Lactarius hengduanensis]|nr:hypothetical protein EDB84DRAFT_1439951 [Lactarius hengduanensis]